MDQQHSGSHLSELDNRIQHLQNRISSLPKSHRLRAPNVRALADARYMRYNLSNQQDDLNRSILYLTEAILLPLPRRGPSINVVKTYWNLTLALLIRAKELKQPKDVKCCVEFFRYLKDQPHPGVIPDAVITFLVVALAIKVELELGDVRGDIEEIAVLCHRLLSLDASDASTGSQKIVSSALVRVVRARFGMGNRWEEEKIIQCLREANNHLPDLHPASITVANSLLERFRGTHSIDDYEDGIAILDEVIAFRAGDTPSPYQENALGNAAAFASLQFHMSGKPDHLEEAVYRLRIFLNVISPDHPLHPSSSRLFFSLQDMRGCDLGGSVRGIHLSNFESPSPSHPPFQALTTSLAQSNMDTFSNDEYLEHLMALQSALSPGPTDRSETEDVVKYCRQLLASPLTGQLGDPTSFVLGFNLFRAYEYTNKVEYLDEAISVARNNLSQDPGLYTLTTHTLIIYLIARFELLRHEEDVNELMQLFPIAVNDISATIPQRFEFSCLWAHVARTGQHPSTPTAYTYAISFMQATLSFSPTLHSQHLRLVVMRNTYEKLPLDYASYLVRRGQLKKAIETLERGRALMWSEMRGFRTSVDKICTADTNLADLADKFTTANKELEMLTLTSNNDLDGGDGGISPYGPYGDLVVRQQKLLDDREKLVSHIQTIPGFENFLEPLSFDTLRSAALHGPVIVINHCTWRSDIIILLRDSPPSLISTSDDFYGRANKLRDQLLSTRRKGLESKDYEDALNFVLEKLYDLVGRPVVKRLNELNVPEQSRVWWCPTSAFCSLPLHAMGPIPSDDGSKRYFSDLYIPSYIPSLSALIESRKPNSQALDRPSILLVVQPDEYMPEALKEMKVVQAVNTQVTTLFSATVKPTTVLRHLRDHRFAHIACHGTLEVGKPFDASFKLYGGERLSLLDIVRSQLPDAEFAFLSACHTAELTEESIADEGLHLTAAMQYCGFRSVIGTMWAMADVDGRDLARDFYEVVFSDQRQGVRYYERTAEALRDAVRRLRRKRGVTSERWVNFVHYGA